MNGAALLTTQVIKHVMLLLDFTIIHEKSNTTLCTQSQAFIYQAVQDLI